MYLGMYVCTHLDPVIATPEKPHVKVGFTYLLFRLARPACEVVVVDVVCER